MTTTSTGLVCLLLAAAALGCASGRRDAEVRDRDAAAPDAPSDAAPPDSAPPDIAPPDSAPPDSAPPDTAPPDTAPLATDDRSALWPRIPRGCGVPRATKVFAPSAPAPLANATHWFFLGADRVAGTRGLYRKARAGGEATLVASDAVEAHLSPDGTRVVYTLNAEGDLPRVLRAVGPDGSAPVELARVAGAYIDNVAVSTDAVYWTTVEYRGSTGEWIYALNRTPLSGGATKTVPGIRGAGLLADDAAVYWYFSPSVTQPDRIQLFRFDESALATGGRPTLLAEDEMHHFLFAGFTQDATHLYFTDLDRVRRVPKAGGEIQTLAAARGETIQTIAVDDTHVYWAEGLGISAVARQEPGYLRAVRKGGGVPIDIAGPEVRSSVFVDDDHVYWHGEKTRGVAKWWKGCDDGAPVTSLPGGEHLPSSRRGTGPAGGTARLPAISTEPLPDVSGEAASYVIENHDLVRVANGKTTRVAEADEVVALMHDGYWVYWLEAGARWPGLRRLDARTGKVTTVVSRPGLKRGALARDARHVYWIERELTYRLMRWPNTGGEAEVLLEDLGPAWQTLWVDDTRIYFVVGEDIPMSRPRGPRPPDLGEIWALPKDEASRTAVPLTSPRPLAAP